MLLAELVATARAVAGTRSRTSKTSLLADLLARLDPDEVEPAVGILSGEPRQGRIGIGWATLARLQPAPASSPSLTVADLDAALDEVVATTGTGSAAGRARNLTELLARATADEADLVRRLLTGEMRQGALEGVMADAIARAAGIPATLVRRAHMLSGELRRTAAVALSEGVAGLASIGLQVLRPVQPMLAATADDCAAAIAATGPASVEWKLDGIRIQVHRLDADVRVFTRNLNDITARVPEVVALALALPAKRFVLDGEAIMLDEHERPHVFQETMSRMGRARAEESVVASFFDCLHVDGEDLLDRTLAERAMMLSEVAGERKIPSIVTADAEAAEAFLAGALEAGHEGVMVKALDSPYQAGRRGGSWLKVKPARTLDLVVIAAEWGHGRRRGWLSNLHLGARGSDATFVMVGKTFKGLTDETLGWQTEQLLAREVARDGITVHVRPELVVEIALDGVQTSTRYAGGVALRFARVKRYRPDKDPGDADTIDAVRALLPSGAPGTPGPAG